MSIYDDYKRENILKSPGLTAWWPLDDLSPQSYARVLTPGQVTGRNILLNGTFADTSAWTLNVDGHTNWSIASGVLHSNGVTADTWCTQAIPMVPGRAYLTTFTVINRTQGRVRVECGGFGTGLGTARNADGTYTEILVATSGTFFVEGDSNFIGDVDNISVVELNIPSSGVPYSNPQLLTDGDMEAVGTAAWTAGNSATLTKQGSAHSGTQCLRVARNGVNSPYAGQTILTIGSVYRVYGYYRSDGAVAPVVYCGATAVQTGTLTTNWRQFDVTFVAAATDIRLGNGSTTGTQYSEFDDVTVVLDGTLRLGEQIDDGNMEATGTAYYDAGQATLSKQGSAHGGAQCLRVTATASAGARTPDAQQIALCLGHTYRMTGWCRSDGTQVPKAGFGTTLFTGTNSTSWQYIDVTALYSSAGSGVNLFFTITGPVGTEYVEFDDISVVEVHPMVGLPVNGVAQQSPALGHLTYAYNFVAASSQLVNKYSAELNSLFNPNEGALSAWIKVSAASVWTDGANRYVVHLTTADNNNEVSIFKSSLNNRLVVYSDFASTIKSVNIDNMSLTTWIYIVLTWSKSANQIIAYVNGVPRGSPQTGLGTWVGNISSTAAAIGAFSSTGSLPFSGKINDVKLYNRAPSALEVQREYRKYLPQYQFARN